MGMQTWERRGLVFNPHVDFFEFIPVEDALLVTEDDDEPLDTVLLDGVKPGRCYEVVITNFYGMPFIRYRTGSVVRFRDRRGRKLPEFDVAGRVEDYAAPSDAGALQGMERVSKVGKDAGQGDVHEAERV